MTRTLAETAEENYLLGLVHRFRRRLYEIVVMYGNNKTITATPYIS